MIIRKANINDIARIRELYYELFKFTNGLEPKYIKAIEQSEDFIKLTIENDNFENFVALVDDEIVGFLIITQDKTPEYECFYPRKFAHIIDIVVDAKNRKQGIASKLIEKAIEWGNERGLDYIDLDVLEKNPNAKRLYKSLGFNEYITTMKKEYK